MNGKSHRFGGDWTTMKLDVLRNYLVVYTAALRNKPTPEHPFRKAYIDAFAGTGSRSMRREGPESSELVFPCLAEPATQQLLDGSTRLALKVTPRFDHYIFIERSSDRCKQLEELKGEFPDLAKDIVVKQGEANQEIRSLCERNWRSHRAVLFLDPYGMQVEWDTIEAIASTKAIDLWVLFPLGIGVSRLLTRSGEIPSSWRERLDKLFGTKDWYEEFYRVEHERTLLGTDEERLVKTRSDVIGRYFNDRLKGVFAAVAEQPGVLRNSVNCPLYLLCFAAGSAKGAPIALRIANHLLKGLR